MGHKSVLIRETIAYILTRDDPKWANWDLFMYENTERKPMILLGTLNGECLCIALCVCVLHYLMESGCIKVEVEKSRIPTQE